MQPPTQNREDILAAIDRFQLQRGTAIGSGIIVSLATIFPEAGIDVSSLIYGRDAPRGVPLDQARKAEKPAFKPVPPGSYTSAAIILLTDGQRTTGPSTIEAAQMAADRGVRVFTVGIGTTTGETIGFEGWSMRVHLDEETLKAIADLTRGEYFYAGTRNGAEEGLRDPELQACAGKKGHGNQRPVFRSGGRDRAGFRVAFTPVVQPDSVASPSCIDLTSVMPNNLEDRSGMESIRENDSLTSVLLVNYASRIIVSAPFRVQQRSASL